MSAGEPKGVANSLDRAATSALVICALILTGLAVKREFQTPPRPAPSGPTYIDAWEAVAAAGHRMGSASAPVQIVEFSDFQCPFCLSSYSTLKELAKRLPERLALVYRHLPLEAVHPQAFAAAVAAECAGEQGRFSRFHDLLFTSPEKVAAESWSLIALEAEVLDDDRFQACLTGPAASARVRHDIDAAESLGLRATPTFLVNGRVIIGDKSLEEWLEIVDSAIDGK